MTREAMLRGLSLGEQLARKAAGRPSDSAVRGGARRHEREISAAVRALRGAAADDAFAVAVVHAATDLMNGCEAAEVRRTLPDKVPDRVLAHVLRHVLLQEDPAAVREHVVTCARPHLGAKFAKAHPNQGLALLGGVHALAVALVPDVDPKAALEEVASLGQDADVVAAICGALLGARFGSDWM